MEAAKVILALDIAAQTGWCVGPLGASKPMFGSQRIAPAGASDGEMFLAFARWLTEMIAVHAPKIVVFESPLDPRRLGDKTNPKTFRRLITMCGLVEMVCQGRGVYDVREVEPADVRRFFIGANPKREEAKRLTMRMCRTLGCEPQDDNAADALAIHHFVIALEKPALAALSTQLFASARRK